MTTYPPQYPNQPTPRPAPTFNVWLIRVPLLAALWLVLIAFTLTAAAAGVQVYYEDRILPNVWAHGVNVGGMPREEALVALEGGFRYDDDAVFTFRDGDRFWQMTAGELGVYFDAEATVERAFTYGREGGFIANAVDQGRAWVRGHGVAPVVTYDQAVAASKLSDIANEVNRETSDALLTVEGGAVNASEAQTGRRLDIPATLQRLDEVILQLNTGAEIPLVVNETPPTVWNADDAAARVRAALAGPITLTATAADGTPLGPWTATPDQLAALLETEQVPNGDGTMRYDVRVSVEAFRPYLESLAPGLITFPQDGRFRFIPETGELEMIEAAVNGRRLDVDTTLARMEAAVFSADPAQRVVPLAFVDVLPTYHENVTAAELGITELVAEGVTYYTGSTANRRENIAVAARMFDGVMIAPGEEFSFNTIVGDISEENGFVEGNIIFGGRTVKGLGGGVCQVSTTAFRAAFYAGFPILERWSHGYRVGYYEIGDEGPGMDAAIFIPDDSPNDMDFRFLNDTDYHLLIQTAIFPADNSLHFYFYSTNPGRQVVKEGPTVQHVVPPRETTYEVNPDLQPGQEVYVDWAAEGAEITINRVILDANGTEIDRDRIFTKYQPWGAVVQVAPGDGRAS